MVFLLGDESCGDVTCIKRIPEMLPQLAVIVSIIIFDCKVVSDLIVNILKLKLS